MTNRLYDKQVLRKKDILMTVSKIAFDWNKHNKCCINQI